MNEELRQISVYLVILNKGVSDIDTSGLQESENHATAKNELVDLFYIRIRIIEIRMRMRKIEIRMRRIKIEDLLIN